MISITGSATPRLGAWTISTPGARGADVVELARDVELDLLAVEQEVGHDDDPPAALGGQTEDRLCSTWLEELEEAGPDAGAVAEAGLEAAGRLQQPDLEGARPLAAVADQDDIRDSRRPCLPRSIRAVSRPPARGPRPAARPERDRAARASGLSRIRYHGRRPLVDKSSRPKIQ